MKTIALLSLLTAFAALTSCETTGDPTQGGLFGWSEHKAQGRQADLQNHLSDVQADTADQQAKTEQLERRRQQLESQQ
jgi:hypothetical protein